MLLSTLDVRSLAFTLKSLAETSIVNVLLSGVSTPITIIDPMVVIPLIQSNPNPADIMALDTTAIDEDALTVIEASKSILLTAVKLELEFNDKLPDKSKLIIDDAPPVALSDNDS